MGSGARPCTLDEFDLHALVDGHLQKERRAAVLCTLATSPDERARVEAWQKQNDLLRSTFAGIEREATPPMLDLSPKSRLQCIPANDAPLVEPAAPVDRKAARRLQIAAAVATILVIAVGLSGSWLLLDSSRPDMAAPATAVVLATAPATETGLSRLPSAHIPDLSAYGFRFAGAETKSNPATILFRYEDGMERLAVSVADASSSNDDAGSAPSHSGDRYGWRRGDATFLVTGTATAARLRKIAAALKRTD